MNGSEIAERICERKAPEEQYVPQPGDARARLCAVAFVDKIKSTIDENYICRRVVRAVAWTSTVQ
eukprot:5368117-Lingulodinium_polyedra.AAC.1